MKNPFIFGKIAEGRHFTDREAETRRLVSNFGNNINTILISPRRWGKSSLVKKAASLYANQRKRAAVFIDLFNIRDEGQFYNYFAKKVIKETTPKPEEWLKTITTFLKRVAPKVSFSADSLPEFELSFELKDKAEDFEDILNLPEKIANSKNIEILVCIDEFQNLSHFSQPELFQKRLRAAWQKHKKTSYCIYGSQNHMMMALFEQKQMPFYKFGEVMYLQKIERTYLVKFITHLFSSSGKKITEELAGLIVDEVERQSYYTQQLAHIVWNNTKDEVTKRIIEGSVKDLIVQNAPLYISDIEDLSNTQVSFLRALIEFSRKDIYAKDFIDKYTLGTTGNVTKIRSALLNKEIIHRSTEGYEIVDPAFRLWLKQVYFK